MTDGDQFLETQFIQDPQGHFRQVYERYSGPLFRFLYRFTANNQASEEILQDIFIELFNDRFKSLEQGTLKSWLFTVAKNRGLNYQKKISRQRDLGGLSPAESASDLDMEEETIQNNLLHRLAQVEHTLPAEIHQAWKLRQAGLDNQAIASQLSIPVGTVKSRFSRLVEYLRKEF